jgi:cellulose synthase/poly-beta-1,6-N-acetylglucosamine synthase-like glycosyltransferase
VSASVPLVTIIVPTRPGQTEVLALTACRALDYPREQLEIIIARGRQPAVQRNEALKIARGELIYFLDDDSRPFPGNLRRAISHFSRAEVKMLGGPNLCPPEAPALEQVLAVALGSWLAFGPSRARYAQLGKLRVSSEKELILCNLVARRASLLELGGFDESLYPNEENALMDDLQKNGGQLLYDPDLVVYRRPRPTLKAFCKMLLNYGRGRAEQFRLHPTFGSILNFVPPLFCLYLALLPFFWRGLPIRGAVAALTPLFVYAWAVSIQTLLSVSNHGFIKSVSALPLLVLTHLLYGLGFWRGLFTRLGNAREHSPREVLLERVTL